MGQHRDRDAQLEDKFAWMREQQRLKQEAAKAGALVAQEEEREARRTGVVVASASVHSPVPVIVGFTWGKPLPRRTKAELARVWRDHRREKNLPKPRTPGCRCGNCPECARRVAHTKFVRNRRMT